MKLKTIEYTLMLLLTIALTYMWLKTPILSRHSLQAFSVAILAFFFIKRTKNAKIWYIMPNPLSAESVAITFAFLLLIGQTGNLNSQFFALGFVHLFFLTMVTETSTLIVTTIAVMLFHYLLSNQLTSLEISNLLSLPLMSIFFLFAKKQYDEISIDQAIIKQEKEEITAVQESETKLEKYVTQVVQPQLESVWGNLQNTQIPIKQLQDQVLTLISDIQKNIPKR